MNSMQNVSKPKPRVKTALFATASLITALSIAERALGFLYRVVLSRLIGAEGMGIYQVSLSVFSVFLTIGTGGIPITVSRLMAKSKAESRPQDAKNSVGAGLLLSLILTLPVAVVLLIFPQIVSFLFSDIRCLPVFRILMLGLVFSTVFAVLRGSFWGNKNFLLPALLEMAEEIVMVIVGVLLLQNVTDTETATRFASWAVVISYFFSFTLSSLFFLFTGGKIGNPKPQLKPLFTSTLPITSVRAGGSLVNSAVAVLLPVMLVKTGLSQSKAIELFGAVSGMAMPVLFIPSTVIGSLSLVLVPELAEDFYKKNVKRLYQNLMRGITVSLLIACFLTPFFYVVGEELGYVAFSNRLAGECIRKGCPILLPMSLTMITTGMLNSMGFEKQTFLYYFLSAGALLLCILFLPRFLGVYAYVAGMIACFSVNAVCNLVLLAKKCPSLFKTTFRKNPKIVRSLALGVITVLPVSLLGALCKTFFSQVLGEVLSLICTGACVAVINVVVFLVIGAIPIPAFFRKNPRKTAKKCVNFGYF